MSANDVGMPGGETALLEASGAQGCGRIVGKGSAGPDEGSGGAEEEGRKDA